MKPMKGLGCFTYLGLMLATGFLVFAYQSLTGQKEDDTIVAYLAIPMIFLAMAINYKIDENDKKAKARERQIEEAEYKNNLEDRLRLWKVDQEEAKRQAKEREEERSTKTCYQCKMRIPRYANICPYCQTTFN
jgi:hypothetical protein